MFYEQLESLCKENGTTPTAFVRDILKLSTSKVTAWSNGSIPKIGTLKEIANYFDVTVGYLFDGKSVSVELSEDQQELLDLYDKLPDRKKGEVTGFIKGILNEQDNKSVKRKGA